jgi:hypothetical protein
MKIILSPIASNKTTQVSVKGLVITVDGVSIDLSVIPENGVAEPSEGGPFVGDVTREKVTIRYYYDSSKALPDQSTNWDDYTFDMESGVVPSPIVWKEGVNV